MRDLGLVKYDEPFNKLLTQGMVLNEIFYRKPENNRIIYFNPADIEIKTDQKGQRISAILKSDGQPVESDGIGTMSKSKNNGVDPQSLIEKYGADTARFFMMFASPPEQTLEWSDAGVEGAYRFLKRVWNFAQENKVHIKNSMGTKPDWANVAHEQKSVRFEIHSIIRQANHDLEKFQFNTVASACMKILNALEGNAAPGENDNTRNQVIAEGTSLLLRLLSPISPHICDYLWRELGYGDDILTTTWPQADPEALQQDEVELVVQVNGKLRGKILVPSDAAKQDIEQMALSDENVARFTEGKNIKKIIIVQGRLVNIVIS